ncbi:MAG: hypothetical protein WA691_06350 [Thermoplasmata archaeon]
MADGVTIPIPGPGSAAFVAAGLAGVSAAVVSAQGKLGEVATGVLLAGMAWLILVGMWIERGASRERSQNEARLAEERRLDRIRFAEERKLEAKRLGMDPEKFGKDLA